jgi:hypothetical protein
MVHGRLSRQGDIFLLLGASVIASRKYGGRETADDLASGYKNRGTSNRRCSHCGSPR